MTAPHATAATTPAAAGSSARQISVLLYSDDRTTRDAVRVNVGRRPARDVEVSSWRECATAAAVIEAVESGSFDVLILDGEAAPVGGLGLCRQLKSEIFNCPPILVLTGRPQDGWPRRGRWPISRCRTRSTRSPCRRPSPSSRAAGSRHHGLTGGHRRDVHLARPALLPARGEDLSTEAASGRWSR